MNILKFSAYGMMDKRNRKSLSILAHAEAKGLIPSTEDIGKLGNREKTEPTSKDYEQGGF